jgi:hypothetical protein
VRLTGYDTFDWEASGYTCGLPAGWIPVVSVSPNVLPRPGTYATLGLGLVSEMTIPGEFLYRGALTFEAAMLNLFKRLNPVDTSPRQLRGIRNDGTPVAIPAVMQISQIVNRGDVNSVKINFVAVQPYWEPLNVPGVTTQVFEADGLRQSMVLDVQGEWPTNPTIRVQANTARTTTTNRIGWRYRRRYTINNVSTDPITNYPFAIDIGLTNGLVTGAKALASGNDLRVVYQGKEVARTLTDWNSASFNTLVWIVIPYLAAGGAIMYEVIYGNPSAGLPPGLLAGSTLPAFDIAVAGANRSTNAKWVYLVDRTVANAGKGGWYLDAGTAQPNVKFNVPGAWQLSTTLVGNDDRSQEAWSTYVATGTKYQARFEARRAKAGSIVTTGHNGADGVYLRNPIGISSVRCDIRWINMARGDTDLTPVGSVVIVGRNRPGDNYQIIYQNSAVNNPESTIAVATYTPAASVDELFFAVWPQPADGITVNPKSRYDRYVNAAWYTTLEINVNSGAMTTVATQAETEIYEFATELRYGGGGDAVDVPPDKAIRLGNFLADAGVGTPRCMAPLTKQLLIFTDTRKVEQWNSAVTVREEVIPIGAYFALDAVPDLNSGATIEQQSADWMPLMPTPNPLTNPDFSVDLSGWTRTNLSGLVTDTRRVDGGVIVSPPLSFAHDIASSTLGSGLRVLTETANDRLPIGTQQSVSVGAELWTSNASLRPRLLITFYTSALAVLSTVLAADWTPPTLSFRRRLLAAAVPAGAVYWSPGYEIWTAAASANGSTVVDVVAVNDTEIAVLDVNSSGLTVGASWLNRYAYG